MNAGRGHARVFAFTRQDAQASNAVVTCILSVCSFDALALIYPGATHSYVSSYFALRFGSQPELLNDPFLVSTPVGESLLAEYVYRACRIRVEGRDTLADLIVLDMIDFDMLMGMDWLSFCYAIVDCHAKIVKFEIPNEPSFILKRDYLQYEKDFGIDLPPNTQPILIPPISDGTNRVGGAKATTAGYVR
nr:uncharacterized protein LOC117274634 [Nicotiana tomentosiformis]